MLGLRAQQLHRKPHYVVQTVCRLWGLQLWLERKWGWGLGLNTRTPSRITQYRQCAGAHGASVLV